MKASITERGWAGHFICGHQCLFHRNTLISFGRRKIVVSTVGNMRRDDKMETIGAFGRYYETMAFEAHKDGHFWEANVSKQISFKSEWGIWAESADKIPADPDNRADKMHDKIVRELIKSKGRK